MGTPYLGEIKLTAFNFPPKGWAMCHGQILSIAQNSALFSILGTTYGGNGTTMFALPDFRGRVPLHFGGDVMLGEMVGQEVHTLIQSELPQHNHALNGATGASGTPLAAGNLLSTTTSAPNPKLYAPATNLTTLHPASIGSTGGAQPHMNMQPYLALNFVISLVGVFPSRN